MLYNLENKFLKLTLSNHGGELHSIKGKKDNVEYLWNGNEDHWKYHSPILFPIVGKVNNGEYRVEGKCYQLPQHGLARLQHFDVVNETSNSISFELKYSDESLKIYPFKFSLVIRYSLEENSIIIDYLVKNIDTKTMYFSIGAHPAFMCPLLETESFNDYYFELNEKETANIMNLVNPGYFTNEETPYLNNENIIELTSDLFEKDALVFNNLKSNKICLKSKNHSKTVEFDFSGFPYLALWSKPTGAPFVCIEPWFGHADFLDFKGEFKDKSGIESLEPSKTFTCTQVINIHE